MHNLRHTFGVCRKLFISIGTLVTLSIPIAFGPGYARSVQTQSQHALTNPSGFKFDTVSIKPNKSGTEAFEVHNPLDAFGATNYSLENLIHDSYGIYEEYRYLGTPSWIKSDRYDIEMKLDSETADRLQTLSKSDRNLAWEHMLQAVLTERFNLKTHRDTKEFPVYFLVVAKGGSKLQEPKLNPDNPSTENGVWGGGGTREGVTTITAHIVPIAQLASRLTSIMGRTVQDKTGLTGRYDLTLKYTPEYLALQSPTVAASEGQPAPSTSDPTDTSIFKALQDQLGLKLESGKGPIEIIVIDHIERASGN